MFAFDAPAISQAPPVNGQSDVIEVVGTRSDQALKIDRRTYRVQQNPHSAQKDSIQLLRGLPAVTITSDDRIMLLGSGNVTIQVDGRTVSDPDTIAYLRTLHGSDLERIEVITNPSAQYSAAGTGGIINFVLRKKQSEGVSGNASGELSSYGHGYFDGVLKSKHRKWTYELHAGGRAGASRHSTYHKFRSVEQSPGGPPTINTESGGGPLRGNEVEGSAKITYDVTPRTSVSAKIIGATANDISTNDAEFTGLTPGFVSFGERQRFSTAVSFVISELNFDHKGRIDGETLAASLRVFGNPRQRERNSADFSDGGALFTDKRKRFLFAEGQIDWQHPMAKGQILSIGGLWNSNRISEDYTFASTSGPLGPPVFDQFHAVEDELAAYATLQRQVGTWTVMPGMRIERNSRRVTSPAEPDVSISRTYVFPTLHVEHPLSRTLDVTLSYSKRIDRPGLNDLRPYPLVQDVITVKQANPRLLDQSVDAYEINLKYHRKKLDAGLIVYDRETAHLFSQSYSSVNGVSLVTIINAGHSRDRGAEIDVSTPVVRRVKLMASVNLFDSRTPVGNATGPTSEDTFRYTANGTLEWDGPDRGKTPGDVAQLQWVYNGPWRQFELHYSVWNQLSLSYTHSFSHTVSASGTLTYNGPNRHSLFASLVQENFRDQSPAEFKVKLLKTFGTNK
jgi:outer membrane receptor protein involved in Fe transport